MLNCKDARVPRARVLRREMTLAERKLWQHLRAIATAHFRRQAAMGLYFADFACRTTRIIIELDGGQHNFGPQQKRDLVRDRYFTNQGYRVLRFWNNDVMRNGEGVLMTIDSALRGAPPTPDPSPPQAGGGETSRLPSSRDDRAER